MANVSLDVTFNGLSLYEKFGIGLLSYKTQSSASRKVRGIDIPGRDGTYKLHSAFASKEITLSVVVEGANPSIVHGKIRAFTSWLTQQDAPKVIFTDNDGVFVKADFDSSSEYSVTRGIDNAMAYLTIELYQYDPFSYSVNIDSYSFDATPGRVYEFLNEGIYTPYTIYLSGTENALTEYMATSVGHNTLTMNGMPIASNIVININGVQQEYSGTLTTNDVLAIDSGELTVCKNGTNAIVDWNGNIEDLINGVNKLIISNTEGVELFVKIEYYRRWL